MGVDFEGLRSKLVAAKTAMEDAADLLWVIVQEHYTLEDKLDKAEAKIKTYEELLDARNIDTAAGSAAEVS